MSWCAASLVPLAWLHSAAGTCHCLSLTLQLPPATASCEGQATHQPVRFSMLPNELFSDVQQGVSSLCKAVEGNFLKMPFDSSSYDAAYAIEATCHADKVGSLHG